MGENPFSKDPWKQWAESAPINPFTPSWKESLEWARVLQSYRGLDRIVQINNPLIDDVENRKVPNKNYSLFSIHYINHDPDNQNTNNAPDDQIFIRERLLTAEIKHTDNKPAIVITEKIYASNGWETYIRSHFPI